MKGPKPFVGSGKTRFNKAKPKDKSWVEARDAAIADGTWVMPKEGKPVRERVKEREE